MREVKYCAECNKIAGRRGGKRFGFILCGGCCKKVTLPNLFSRTHPLLQETLDRIKLKQLERRCGKGFRNLKDYEKRYLWIKHVKQGESAEQASMAIKGIVNMVRKHHNESKESTPKESFKESFNKLVKGGEDGDK